jgi:hypothetical protein
LTLVKILRIRWFAIGREENEGVVAADGAGFATLYLDRTETCPGSGQPISILAQERPKQLLAEMCEAGHHGTERG